MLQVKKMRRMIFMYILFFYGFVFNLKFDLACMQYEVIHCILILSSDCSIFRLKQNLFGSKFHCSLRRKICLTLHLGPSCHGTPYQGHNAPLKMIHGPIKLLHHNKVAVLPGNRFVFFFHNYADKDNSNMSVSLYKCGKCLIINNNERGLGDCMLA